ncbi:transmembrane protein 135-like [Brevipalpus obovatus]|uniref:transmembrane protein 135-like n=1 Tax=Brevipalpus obovatus TaxID=246614 RepID=UPI003D9F4464
MPSILSKFVPYSDLCLPFNCYEVGHTWTPYCSKSAFDIGSYAFMEAFKMYSGLYLFNQAVSGRYDVKNFLKTLQSILRSSAFIGFNAYAVLVLFCFSSRCLGRIYLSLIGHVPSILGSFMAIHIEKSSRRGPLAFYVANIATETLYRLLVYKKLLKPLPYGEVILFTSAMSVMVYFVKKNGFSNDAISFALKLVIGKQEFIKSSCSNATVKTSCTSYTTSTTTITTTSSSSDRLPQLENSTNSTSSPPIDSLAYGSNGIHHRGLGSSRSRSSSQLLSSCSFESSTWITKIASLIQSMATSPYSSTCNPPNSWPTKYIPCSSHPHSSCLKYISEALMGRFLLGWAGSSVVRIALGTWKRRQLNINQISSQFSNQESIKFGLFLATMASLYKASNCVIRRTATSDHNWHGALSGAIAGLSMLFYPSKTIAQYILWKAIEITFWDAVKNGIIKHPDFITSSIYSLSCSQLFFVAVISPTNLRPSYMKFLDRFTHHALHLLNRNIIDLFGTGSSTGFDTYIPNLDLKHTSRQFQEAVLVWTIR